MLALTATTREIWESGDRTCAVTDPHEQLATALDDRRRLRALLGQAQECLASTYGAWGVNWLAWEHGVRECDCLEREVAEIDRDIRTLCARIALRF